MAYNLCNNGTSNIQNKGKQYILKRTMERKGEQVVKIGSADFGYIFGVDSENKVILEVVPKFDFLSIISRLHQHFHPI